MRHKPHTRLQSLRKMDDLKYQAYNRAIKFSNTIEVQILRERITERH